MGKAPISAPIATKDPTQPPSASVKGSDNTVVAFDWSLGRAGDVQAKIDPAVNAPRHAAKQKLSKTFLFSAT